MNPSPKNVFFILLMAMALVSTGCDEDSAGTDPDVDPGADTMAGPEASGAGVGGSMAQDETPDQGSNGEDGTQGTTSGTEPGPVPGTPDTPDTPDSGDDQPGGDGPNDGEEEPADGTETMVQPAARVTVSIRPERTYYRDIDHPNVSVQAFDAADTLIANPVVVWRIAPEGIAEVSGAGVMSFLSEGQGNLEGCVDNICDSLNFMVDFGPPVLEVLTPQDNHMASGETGILVSGTAIDTSPALSVTVNDTSVEVDAGVFSAEVPATFGVNKVVIEASDGITPAARVVRNVIWAPRYLPAGVGSVDISPALALRLDQAMVDDGGVAVLPAGAGRVDISSLGTLIEAVVSLVDFDSLLDDLDFGLDNPGMEVTLGTLTVGRTDAEIEIIADGPAGEYPFPQGLYLVVKLEDVSIDVTGQINPALGGNARIAAQPEPAGISVSGRISTAISLYTMLDITVDNGEIVVVGADTRVVVEPLVATGLDDDSAASPILELLTADQGGLGAPLEETVAREVGGLMDDLAPIVQNALSGLIGDLGDIPLNFESPYEGADPVDLAMSMNPATVSYQAEEYLRIVLDGNITSNRPLETLEHDQGVPAMAASAWVETQGEGLGISVALDLFNALLHELWRSGILTIDLSSLPVEAQLIGIMSAAVDAHLPPIIVPKEGGGEYPLELQIAALGVDITKVDAMAADVYSVNLRAGLRVLFQPDETGESKLRFELSSEPDIVVELMEDNSGAALAPSLLGTLFGLLIWPEVEGLLTDSLDLGLEPSDVSLSSLINFVPRARSLRVDPVLDGPLQPSNGRLKVEGDLDMVLTVCDADGTCPADQ